MDREQRRADITLLIQAAAEWGWVQARRRHWWQRQTFVAPIVMWSEDGTPAIVNEVH